jgi:hypothetical protein
MAEGPGWAGTDRASCSTPAYETLHARMAQRQLCLSPRLTLLAACPGAGLFVIIQCVGDEAVAAARS